MTHRTDSSIQRLAPAYPHRQPRVRSTGLHAGGFAQLWRLLRRGLTLGLLALLVLGLAGLSSYPLELSKPRSPNVPVERICRQRFQVEKGVQIPICLSVESLDAPNPHVKHAVIVVHGTARNASGAFVGMEAAMQANERRDLLIVAPQFLTTLDLEGKDPPPDVALWRSGSWSQGDRSVEAGSPARPGSFEVLDKIVEEIVRPHRYPNLADITIAGHSAGGQFVQRYAAGTRIEQQMGLAARKIQVRYVAANPSSYVYLFPREPNALTERCPRYDAYKYGLNDLNVYLRPVGAEQIRAAYAQKDVTVLLGRQDHEMLDPAKDDSCEAIVQGANRVNRGIRYVQQLDQGYGIGQHHTRLVMVPGVGHDGRGMFTSPEGRAVLLGP